MKQKLLILLLAFIASISASAYDFCVDGIYYNISGSEATVTYKDTNYNSYSGSLTIPASVTYNNVAYSVTSIGEQSFQYCSGLTSVDIPNSVTSIDWNAFCLCTSLTSVTIPNSVTLIGSQAFYKCYGLTSVDIPNSVTSIGSYAFFNCSGLTSVDIPNSVTSIGNCAFYDCIGMTLAIIGNSVTSIGNNAFYNCNQLKIVINTSPNFTIKRGNTSNGYLGYYANVVRNIVSNLRYDNLYYIAEDGACTITGSASDAKNLIIPNAINGIPVTKIAGYAFQDYSLYSIEIPSSVISIGNLAFGNCSNLYKVILSPNTVPEGISSAFTALDGRMTYTGNHNYDDHVGVLGTINVYTNLSSKFLQGGVLYVPEPLSRTVDAIDCDYLTMDVTVPSEVTYLSVVLTVKDIKNHAFRGHDTLSKLTIGGQVNSIGDYAFKGCSNIIDVTFGSGSTTLSVGRNGSEGLLYDTKIATLHLNRNLSYDYSPFLNNKYLNALFIGGGCTNVHTSMFIGCSNIATVNVSGNVQTIGADAFKGLQYLTDVALDGTNLSIGKRAFMNCTNLANLVLDTNVAKIGDCAFRGCSKIRSTLRLGQELDVTVGKEAFMDCSAITSFTLGNNITSIGDRAFKNCNLITKFNLCEKITSIGSGAFADCSTITSINVPSKITVINDSTFMGCSALSNITLPSGLTTLGAHALNGTAIQTLTLPDGVTELKDGVVANTPLVSFRVTPLIRSIGNGAFDNCNQLADLTIEKSANKLQLGINVANQGLFYDCKLDNLVLARPLEYGAEYADGYSPFRGNKTLKNVTLSDNARTIGARMFANCTNLETVVLSEDVMQLGASAFAGSGVITINIPSKVTIIPANCFQDCPRLATLTIPETVKTIDAYAFSSSGLKNLALPASITVINDHTFYNTKSLESLTINNGLVTIDTYAFAGSGLMSLTIPNSVKAVNTGAFDGALRLADLRIENGTEALQLANTAATKGLFDGVPLKTVYIGRELSYEKSSGYGYSPFYRNTTLEEVEFGDIPVEVFAHEFDGCTALLNVTIGDAVKKISEYGFAGCSAMESFTVGASITTIADEAFSDCSSLAELRSYAPLPPVCGNQALADINKFQCTLYVPNSSTNDYRSAEQWNEFFFVEEFDAGVKVSYIEMSQNNATMKAGETLQITAVAYPETAMLRTVNWASTNAEVATVSSTGLVTANRAGVADIQAIAADGSGVKGVCRITVVADNEPGVFRFEISNTDVYPDIINRIPVRMYNESAVTAFQCDVILPTGVKLAKDEYDDYYIEMSDRAPRHQATINETDGVITIAVYHMSNAEIEGTEGTLFYLPLEVTGDERSCTMSMRNIHLSKVGNIDEELTPISAVLNVQPRYVMGDANGDGKVSVTDFTTVISYIVNNQVSNFVFAAADMDGDGRILIADATAILSKSLTSGSAAYAPARYSNRMTAIDALVVDEVSLDADGNGNVSIWLDGSSTYIACQMDILLPEGIEAYNVEIGEANGNTHDVVYQYIAPNSIRVIACSMNNSYFVSDNVLNLSIRAKQVNIGNEIIVCNAIAVAKDIDCTPEVPLMNTRSTVDSYISGLDSFTYPQLNIYIEGRNLIIESSTETNVTMANLLGQNRTLQVYEGINRFALTSSGAIIINNKKYIVK